MKDNFERLYSPFKFKAWGISLLIFKLSPVSNEWQISERVTDFMVRNGLTCRIAIQILANKITGIIWNPRVRSKLCEAGQIHDEFANLVIDKIPSNFGLYLMISTRHIITLGSALMQKKMRVLVLGAALILCEFKQFIPQATTVHTFMVCPHRCRHYTTEQYVLVCLIASELRGFQCSNFQVGVVQQVVEAKAPICSPTVTAPVWYTFHNMTDRTLTVALAHASDIFFPRCCPADAVGCWYWK